MNLTIIRGLPGSGKTTLATKLTADTDNTAHVETDIFFTDEETGLYKFDGMNIGNAHAWCQEQTDKYLGMEYDVFVSNTFTTLNELRPYFQIAKKHGITPTVIHCQNDWGSIHDVPDAVVMNMRKRFVMDIQTLFDEIK